MSPQTTTLSLSNPLLLRERVSFTACLVLSHGHTVRPPRNQDGLVPAFDVNPAHFKRPEGPTNSAPARTKEKPEGKLEPARAARGDPEVGGAFRAGIGPCSRPGSARTAGPGHADSGSNTPGTSAGCGGQDRGARRPAAGPLPARPAGPAPSRPRKWRPAPSLRRPGSSPAAPGPRARAGTCAREAGTRRETSPGRPHPTLAAAQPARAPPPREPPASRGPAPGDAESASPGR